MNICMYYVRGIGHTDRPWGRCLSLCLLEVDIAKGEGRQYKSVICPIFCTPPTTPNMVMSSNIHTDSLFCPEISPTPEVSGFPCWSSCPSNPTSSFKEFYLTQQLSKDSMTNTALGAMLVGQKFGVNKKGNLWWPGSQSSERQLFIFSLLK